MRALRSTASTCARFWGVLPEHVDEYGQIGLEGARLHVSSFEEIYVTETWALDPARQHSDLAAFSILRRAEPDIAQRPGVRVA